ncbi:hypothetical protein RUM43_007782 [Polyplax serrata]|uniref:Uncharacterized protein n=1 Tax=Polyplax serrata TaxID=468196 RepID=A0AAN8P6D8_POLSC
MTISLELTDARIRIGNGFRFPIISRKILRALEVMTRPIWTRDDNDNNDDDDEVDGYVVFYDSPTSTISLPPTICDSEFIALL